LYAVVELSSWPFEEHVGHLMVVTDLNQAVNTAENVQITGLACLLWLREADTLLVCWRRGLSACRICMLLVLNVG